MNVWISLGEHIRLDSICAHGLIELGFGEILPESVHEFDI